MKTREQKAIEIILGTLASLGLWVLGFVMSGTVALGDTLELYETGPLILFYPIVVGAAFILVALKCAKGKALFYKSFIITFFFPFVCWIYLMIGSIIESELHKIFGNSPLTSFVGTASFIVLPAVMLPLSVFAGLSKFMDDDVSTIFWLVYSIAPVIAGLISSIVIYNRRKEV